MAGVRADKGVSLLSRTSERWDLGNESQNIAVQEATNHASAITLIQGPPGSGKTVTSAEIVRRWLVSSDDPVRLNFNNNLLVLLISFKLNGNTLEFHPHTVLW